MDRFTVEDLIGHMRACAGEDAGLSLDGDVADRTFQDLGYDSLAVMETTSRIERQLGVSLPENDAAGIETLREYVNFVNTRLTHKVSDVR